MDTIKQMMLKTNAKGKTLWEQPSRALPPTQHLLRKSFPVSKGKKEK